MPSREDSFVVTLSGKQSPGALADVMRVLGTDDNARLIDFGQLVVRNRFIATALISGCSTRDILKEILFRAHESGLQVDFDVASNKAQQTSPSFSSTSSLSSMSELQNQYVLTVISQNFISATFLSKLTSVLQRQNVSIVGINRLTEAGDDFMCLEIRISVSNQTDMTSLQRHLFELGRSENDCDMALQQAKVSRRAKRMVVFDLSWTLVQCDAIDVLLTAAGKTLPQDEEKAFAEGSITRSEWLQTRVQLLRGLPAAEVNTRAAEALKFTDGAVELCKGLKRLGCKLAVVSSGSKDIAEAARSQLGLDFVFGNVLEIDSNGRFTGSVKEPIVDVERKAELVQMLAMQERIDVEQIIAVGDGPVSLKMLECAGMSIAYDQPDATDNVHSGRIRSKSLAGVLYLLGVSGDDFRRVTT